MSDIHMEDFLSSYLEGDLSETQAREIERHLASCAECSSLLKALAETREALAGTPELEPSANLLRRLYAIPEMKKFRLNLEFLFRPSLQPFFAGASVVLLFISFLIFSPNGKAFQKNLNREMHAGYNKIEKLYAKAEAAADGLSGSKNALLGTLKDAKIIKKS